MASRWRSIEKSLDFQGFFYIVTRLQFLSAAPKWVIMRNERINASFFAYLIVLCTQKNDFLIKTLVFGVHFLISFSLYNKSPSRISHEELFSLWNGYVWENGWFQLKFSFSDLTRKIQERQMFCEGAYPQWSVTEQNTKYFTVFFRQKSTRWCDRAFYNSIYTSGL